MRALSHSSLAAFLLLALPQAPALCQQKTDPPLPDIRQLMKEAHEHQKQLEKLQENYTFSESEVVQDLDSNGKVNKTETYEHEVFYVDAHPISRMVKKDGKALNDEEEKKETDRVSKDVEKAQKPDQPKEDEQISLRLVLEAADVRNPRRQIFRGRSTIVFDFAGRRDLKAHGLSQDLSKKLQGTVWVDEADRQVAHLEATFDDNFHIAGGLVANVQKGSHFSFDQAPVEAGLWLPTGAEITVQMRVMLFKGIHRHVTARNYDYKRFRVDAEQGKDAKALVETKQ